MELQGLPYCLYIFLLPCIIHLAVGHPKHCLNVLLVDNSKNIRKHVLAILGETKSSLYHADKIQTNSFKAGELSQV